MTEKALRGTAPGFALWAFVAWVAVTAMWWALAFAPLPVPPQWLEAARSVCFGTQPNGLPEPWGWAGLIVSPLAMLAFLLAVWGRELGGQLRAATRAPLGRALVAMLLAVPLVGAYFVGERVAGAKRFAAALEVSTLPAELPAHYPRRDVPAPALGLVDQGGVVVAWPELAGRPVLVTFAFAHCRTVCPMVVGTVRRAAAEIPEANAAVVIVTLDPWRDTPSSLPALAAAWDLEDLPLAKVLSGEVAEVLAVLDAWDMPHERDPRTGDVSHPALVHVVAPDGTLGYTFNAPPVAWVTEAVRRLTNEAPARLAAAQSSE